MKVFFLEHTFIEFRRMLCPIIHNICHLWQRAFKHPFNGDLMAPIQCSTAKTCPAAASPALRVVSPSGGRQAGGPGPAALTWPLRTQRNRVLFLLLSLDLVQQGDEQFGRLKSHWTQSRNKTAVPGEGLKSSIV